MLISDFLNLSDSTRSFTDLPSALRALWLDKKEKWDAAHETVQDENDRMSALVHAYLHRKEGDIGNARYWYSSAGRKPFNGSLSEEWETITLELLERVTLK